MDDEPEIGNTALARGVRPREGQITQDIRHLARVHVVDAFDAHLECLGAKDGRTRMTAVSLMYELAGVLGPTVTAVTGSSAEPLDLSRLTSDELQTMLTLARKAKVTP